MKSIHSAGTIGKLLLAFSFLFSIGIMTSTTAQAQWGNNDPYYRNDRDREREQRRREREARREQRRRDRQYDNDGYYGNNGGYYGNNGYGYGRGRSSDGYGNYGGSFDLRQTALNAGFADGVKEGRRDRSRGERYDYTDESAYQNGTRDYNSRFGDRYIYQRYYREAFSHGYADGYSGY